MTFIAVVGTFIDIYNFKIQFVRGKIYCNTEIVKIKAFTRIFSLKKPVLLFIQSILDVESISFLFFFSILKTRFAVNVVKVFAQWKKTKRVACAVYSTAVESWVASAVVSSHGIVADGIHLTLMIVIEAFVNVWKINLFVFLR